jgi:hypothetical protein
VQLVDAVVNQSLFQRSQHRASVALATEPLDYRDLVEEGTPRGAVGFPPDPEPAHRRAVRAHGRPHLVILLGRLGKLAFEHRPQLRTGPIQSLAPRPTGVAHLLFGEVRYFLLKEDLPRLFGEREELDFMTHRGPYGATP